MCLLKQAYTSGSFQSGLLDPFFVFTEGLSLQEKRGVEGDSERATCTLSHLVKQLVLLISVLHLRLKNKELPGFDLWFISQT